jgi:DNA helicase MCM8
MSYAQRQAKQSTTGPSSESLFVKDAHLSCLRDVFRLVFSGGANVRLPMGRQIITLVHDDFLSEINHFENKGPPSKEFVQAFSIGAALYHLPDDTLTAMGCAIRLALLTLWMQQQEEDVQVQESATEIQQFLDQSQYIFRFVHVEPSLAMIDVRTGIVSKFISVKGHVVKARPKQLRVATADFSCSKCGGIVTHSFEAGNFSIPTLCTTEKCKSRAFSLMRSTARYINVQHLRLQEAQEESIVHAGRTPRQMNVELTHDLVDVCRPGDIIMLACTVAAINTAVSAGKTGRRAQESSTYDLFLKGHSVTSTSETNNRRRNESSQSTYTQQQLQRIVQLCHADHRYFGQMERRAFPFDLLVRSLCPSIIGHNAVKAGLLLCLLGGTPVTETSSREHSVRSNSHMLVVGDPGMGKSQMLLAASQLAARSVYVGGNTSSTTGLTVTLTKEEGGETGIEAGALVLGDQGLVCIDEFDKMASNHQDGLLEAMEQQQVSIAKAGVVATLPARCSIIAAANPKHGSYNMGKSVAENLNMAKPILSRFDLVFILRDKADKALDQLVSSNIMNLYRTGKQATISVKQTKQSTSHVQSGNRMSLSDRLAWVNEFQKDPLPASLVRDYIAYAREYCKPKLTAEAAEVLKDYYMSLRYPGQGGRRSGDTVPITTRQLEALIRLCQARAKACLRDFCLKEDALDVVELMSLSVEQVHADEYGCVDPSRGGAAGTSKRKMKKLLMDEIVRVVGVGAECSLDDLRRVADRVRCGLNEFPSLVEDLRNNGLLMKKSNGRFQVMA